MKELTPILRTSLVIELFNFLSLRVCVCHQTISVESKQREPNKTNLRIKSSTIHSGRNVLEHQTWNFHADHVLTLCFHRKIVKIPPSTCLLALPHLLQLGFICLQGCNFLVTLIGFEALLASSKSILTESVDTFVPRCSRHSVFSSECTIQLHA